MIALSRLTTLSLGSIAFALAACSSSSSPGGNEGDSGTAKETGSPTNSEGGTSGTVTPPCDTSATDGICFQKGYTAAECATMGGTTPTSCATASLVGCCIIGLNEEECFYSPTYTTATAMRSCMDNGTYQTGL
jgi:hypothetical protein